MRALVCTVQPPRVVRRGWKVARFAIAAAARKKRKIGREKREREGEGKRGEMDSDEGRFPSGGTLGREAGGEGQRGGGAREGARVREGEARKEDRGF